MKAPTLGGWVVDMMRKADGALSLEEALHVILEQTKENIECQSLAALLLDEQTRELRIKNARQISHEFVKKFLKSGPNPFAERVVLEQRPLVLNKIKPTSDIYRQIKLEHDFKSALVMPIAINHRGAGYVFCDRADGSPFTKEEVLCFRLIGHVIGSLITKFDLIRTARRLSRIDEASGALHFKAFVEAYATEVSRARAHDYPLTLALVMVDAFRRCLDTYGIDAAHALLADVAGVVKDNIRGMDILARFGADEFIICLSGLNKTDAIIKLGEIRKAVAARPLGTDGGKFQIRLIVATLPLSKDDMAKDFRDLIAQLCSLLADAKGHERLKLEDMP